MDGRAGGPVVAGSVARSSAVGQVRAWCPYRARPPRMYRWWRRCRPRSPCCRPPCPCCRPPYRCRRCPWCRRCPCRCCRRPCRCRRCRCPCCRRPCRCRRWAGWTAPSTSVRRAGSEGSTGVAPPRRRVLLVAGGVLRCLGVLALLVLRPGRALLRGRRTGGLVGLLLMGRAGVVRGADRDGDSRPDRDQREHDEQQQLAAAATALVPAFVTAVIGIHRRQDRALRGVPVVRVPHRHRAPGHAHGRGVPALVHRDRAGVPRTRVAALDLEHLKAVLDQAAHLLGALEPVVRVLRERAHDQPVQLRRHRAQDLGRRDRNVLDVLVHHRQRGLAGERGPQRQEFVEQAAGGVEVGAVVDGLAQRLLGERYWGVPMTMPVWVIVDCAPCNARAMPKSITLTAPELVMITLAGLMSRCTMPCWCEYASASSTPETMISACSGGGARH